MAVGEDVYCTLVMGDSYLPGAAVLAKSLRDGGTQKKLACMIVQDYLRPSTVTELQSLYNYVIPVSPIPTPNVAALYLMNRPDLLYSFTKINLWRLTQFRRIIYADADMVALRPPDELFQLEDSFAAAPDVGFPDIFNSGFFVTVPNEGVYEALRTMAAAGDSFDGADQGLLNQYFEHKPWKRLSFIYNCTPNANYQYEPAYRYYKRDISMVHFIGKEKPWQRERQKSSSPGAYQELLSRWWAVYDRHFKVSTSDYLSGRREPISRGIQQEVKSETRSPDQGYYATGYPVESTQPAPAPQPPSPSEAPVTTTESPFTEPGEDAKNIDQGRIESQPTIELRRFSAPHMEWDATRFAPPTESKPEAPNFPTATYEFSTDSAPFRPPASYPKPPRSVHYEVPKMTPKKEEKLTPIFPWEERELSKPTRKFVDDEPLPPPPMPEPKREEDVGDIDELEVRAEDNERDTPETSTTQVTHVSPWEGFDARTKNAWDNVTGIESYVRALTVHQKNRGKVHVIQTQVQPQFEQTHILSPTNEPNPEELIERVKERRESLILTDFPTAIERPSLPVTPAPIRRSTFWSGEKEGEDQLPPAEGVPSQEDWDPSAQLEQLRRNSLLGLGDLKLPEKTKIPDRKMPQTSMTVLEETLKNSHVPISGSGSSPDVERSHPQRVTDITDTADSSAAKAVPENG